MFDTQAVHPPGILAFAAAYAIIAIIPGPNLLIVARASMAGSRYGALITAWGVACGASLLALVAASSSAVFITDTLFRASANAVFAMMLLMVGVKLISNSGTLARAAPVTPSRSPHFGVGFLTALSNPISAVFFSSASVHFNVGVGGSRAEAIAMAVFLVAACWFGLVALAISVASTHSLFARCQRPIRLGAGALLIWYGSVAIAGVF